MRRILIVSVGTPTGKSLTAEVNEIFREYAQAEYCLCHQLEARFSGQEIVLFSSKYCEALCSPFALPGASVLSAYRTINYRNIQKVIELEAGIQVLLVNDCRETAAEAIDQLIEIGLDELRYIPYYPGSREYPEVDVAITPGESACVPPYVRQIIDIDNRSLDIRTIYDLIRLLDAKRLLTQNLVARYLREIVSVSKSFFDSRRRAEQSEQLLETIVNSVDYGVACVDSGHRFIWTNPAFDALLGPDGRKALPGGAPLREGSFVASVNGRQILFHVKAMDGRSAAAFLITADDADTIHKRDRRIRKEQRFSARSRLYTFGDYLTENDACRRMLTLAERFARTDGTVLIQGESGTGKEILAQGIHSASARRRQPFLPVNIASLTATLAESELFGYEDASFTGARRGGKAGIFELAERGTVFIDEIGDATPELQAKLLRALEEKSIRRVGGAEEIPIQASVIAATNRDLPEMVRAGQFRKDLFFRLSMFPLQTVPLRERKEDILLLLRHFLRNALSPEQLQTVFSAELTRFFEVYAWPGNVRELMNTAEYIRAVHEEGPLYPEDLPAYMRTRAKEEAPRRIFLSEAEYHVLRAIAAENGKNAGRERLRRALLAEGIEMGTGTLRAMLKQLTERGLTTQTPAGSTLTKEGRAALQE